MKKDNAAPGLTKVVCCRCALPSCIASVGVLACLLTVLWVIALTADRLYPDVFSAPAVAYDVPFTASSLAYLYFPSPPPPVWT